METTLPFCTRAQVW